MIPELTEQGFPPESIARMLVNELRAAPQLRELVLRELLTEDFLNLPHQVERLENTVTELRGELTARMDGMQNQMEGMQGQMGDMRGDISELKSQFGNMQGQFGNLRGESYENKCAQDIELVLVDYVDNPVLADREEIRSALVRARRNGTLSRIQYDRARVVDILAVGADMESGQPVLAVVEASVTINDQDVNAAHERAAILRDVTGRDARPFCVANVAWSADLAETAGELSVTLVHYELPHFDGSGQ